MLAKNGVVKIAKNALKRLRNDTATIFIYDNAKNPHTGLIRKEKRVLETDIPCSVSTNHVAGQNTEGVMPSYSQLHTLYFDTDVHIPSGACFEVTHDGDVLRFVGAGIPMRYATHQEIAVKREEKYHG